MICAHSKTADLGVVGEMEIARAVRRREIARRECNRIESEHHDGSDDYSKASVIHRAIVGRELSRHNDYRRLDAEAKPKVRMAMRDDNSCGCACGFS
jgi:hypothetical protein